MAYKPDISQLLNLLYSTSKPVYSIQDIDNSSPDLSFSGIETITVEKANRMSQYGHPILFPFKVKGKTYKRFNLNGELIDFHLPSFEFPASTLVEFSRAKKIQLTEITSGDGAIPELIGFANWQITIRGVCFLDNSRQAQKTPQKQYEELLKWEQVAGHIELESGQLFTDKGIYALVIERFSVTTAGGANGSIIPFEMQCISDKPMELIL